MVPVRRAVEPRDAAPEGCLGSPAPRVGRIQPHTLPPVGLLFLTGRAQGLRTAPQTRSTRRVLHHTPRMVQAPMGPKRVLSEPAVFVGRPGAEIHAVVEPW